MGPYRSQFRALHTCGTLHRDTGKYLHLEILEISLISESGQTEKELTPNIHFIYVHHRVNVYKNDDTFESKFTRHVSVVQRPSSVESRINLKLHLNL